MVKPKRTDLPQHPIAVVSARTGISVGLLRAWERRHAIVKPARSPDGRRLYTDADVEHLRLVYNAARAGRTVSAVAHLPVKRLKEMVAEDAESTTASPSPAGSFREEALDAVRDLASERLEAVLRRALLSLGTITFLEEVAAPLLLEIGDAWHEGRITVAHEHAASATMLQLLGWLTRALQVPGTAPRVLLATPFGQQHAFGAMMAAVAAAHDGWHVTWLGADLPAKQIAAGAQQGDARAVALSAVSKTASLAGELRELRALLPAHVPVLLGGAAASSLRDLAGITSVKDLRHWRAVLTTFATAQ